MSDTQSPNISAATRAFLDREHALLIGGEWTRAGAVDSIPVENPATGEIFAEAAGGGDEAIDAAVEAARQAFMQGPWPALGAIERGELLADLAKLLEQHAETLTELEILDNGMPLNPVAMLAAPGAAKTFRYYAGWPTKITGTTLPLDQRPGRAPPLLTYTRREPVGVVGQIVPWNYPLGMAAMKLGPALATGCTVVLKPDEKTPLSALLLGELIREAGIPAGVVNIVPGYGEKAGAALAAHPGVDKVAFTGSTDVGRKIIQASAGNLKRVSLELGGKAPFVVFPDADLEQAVANALRSAFFLQGQNCQCAARLLVHEDIHDEFVARLVTGTKALRVGPGWDPESRLGPLISAGQLERVQGYVENGRTEGAELMTGGTRLDRPGYFMEPAVFAQTRPAMRITREEIFGPVTCVQTFSGNDLDEIAALANDTIYGLVASVWTRDLHIAHGLAAKIQAGIVGINHHGGGDISAPFGGYKQSGWGREYGAESLDLYLESKTVVVRA